jgi:hypothetical protein
LAHRIGCIRRDLDSSNVGTCVAFSEVGHYLREHNDPLVLATVGENIPIWREMSASVNTHDEFVAGNPEHTPLKKLHDQAWTLVNKQPTEASSKASERLSNAKGTSRAILGLSQVLPAAVEGKIDALFVDCRKPMCGRFDRTTGEVMVQHCMDGKCDSDLLETAIRETLQHRGKVFALQTADDLPNAVEAILRY